MRSTYMLPGPVEARAGNVSIYPDKIGKWGEHFDPQ
jgi:hypothetical protein